MKFPYTSLTSKFCGFLTIALLSTNIAFSQVILVDMDAPGTVEDGASWATAFTNLQDALSIATNGDSIWVAEGTYYPSSTLDPSEFFDIKEEISVFGGFLGVETDIRNRDWENNVTILSGDIDEDGSEMANSYTVCQMSLDSAFAEVNGFTITLGIADQGNSADIRRKTGGAIYIDGGTSNGGFPIIRNCTFTDNYAAVNGGAIYSNGTSGGYAHSFIENCTFEGNRSIFKGGAISNDGESSPAIINCTFSTNRSSEGAAIFNNGSNKEASPQIINCVFSENRADNIGGAIFNFGNGADGISCPLILNCLIYNDTAASAAGVYNFGNGGIAKPEIINCTFYGNYATTNGGHIYGNESNGGDTHIKVRNSILWGSDSNFAPHFGFSTFDTGTPTIDIDYSFVDTEECSDMNLSADGTLLCGGTMGYNISPLFIDSTRFDFRLQANSPAINFGDDSEIPTDLFDLDKDGNTTEAVPFDLDLNPRFDNEVDLGPYERAGSLPGAYYQVLPIALLSFDARLEEGKVALTWVTLTEENNDYFTIERSANGVDFEEITREDGAGTSTLARQYRVYDNNPFSGTNYYRLKQTDYDGTESYSEVESIDVLGDGQITVFPNPATTEIQIALSQFKVRSVDFEIYHLSGKKMFAGSADVNEGIVLVSLTQIDNLLPGSYVIRLINTNQGDLYGKFVKVGL